MASKFAKYFSYSITQLDKTFNPNNDGFEFDLVLGKDKFKAVADKLFKDKKFKEPIELWNITKGTKVRGKITYNTVETINTANIQEYLDPKMFATELKNSLEAVAEERTEKNNRSESSAAVGRELVKITRVPFELALPATSGEYNEKDEELFNWFAVDDNPEYNKQNVYMKDKNGKYLPIYMNKTATGYRAEFDTQAFHDAHRDDYIKWASDAANMYMSLRDNAAINRIEFSGTEVDDILEAMHKVLPKAVMHECKLEVCFVPNEDNDLIFNSVKLRLNSANRNTATWEETNIADMMSIIIPRLNKRKMPVLKRYSIQLSDPAILSLPMDYICSLINGDKSPLPDVWREFLSTKFSKDKEAQLYRIAKFMVSVLDPTNYSRQMLCMADKGHSGKTAFINAIQKGLNRLSNNFLFAKQVNNNALAKQEKSQDGLEDVMDSRLVIATEVNNISDFVDAPNVKNLTGCDTVVASVKFAKPVYKNMAGTKIIVCTNNWVNVKNMAVETRIIPIVFEAYKGISDPEISNKLADTIEGFLAWCLWYSKRIEAQRNYKNKNNCEIYSSDNPEYTVKQVFQNLQSEGQIMFRYHMSEEYNIRDEEFLSDLCTTLGIRTSETKTDNISYNELCESLKAAALAMGMSPRVVEPFSNRRGKDWDTLKAYIIDKYGAEAALSNGKRVLKGITFAPPPMKSKDAQAWANDIPKKEHREDNNDYSDSELDPNWI